METKTTLHAVITGDAMLTLQVLGDDNKLVTNIKVGRADALELAKHIDRLARMLPIGRK
jgi:hypothetical protein